MKVLKSQAALLGLRCLFVCNTLLRMLRGSKLRAGQQLRINGSSYQTQLKYIKRKVRKLVINGVDNKKWAFEEICFDDQTVQTNYILLHNLHTYEIVLKHM